MITIAICDDETIVHKELRDVIAAYSIAHNEDIRVLSYNNINDLLASETFYNILFLDIRFESSDIGLDAARTLRTKGNDCIIVLLTSLKTKAIEGYDVGAFRYLLKPIQREPIFLLLRQALSHIRNRAQVISIKHEYGTEIIPTRQIRYVQSLVRKRYIYLETTAIETWETLKEIFEKLPYGEFGYLQKGTVVNFERISCLKKNNVVIDHTIELGIGRQYKQLFFEQYFRYIGK